jgi:hypothetical protein
MIGDEWAIFDCAPALSIETTSYNTVARITHEDFIYMTYENLDIKEKIINSVIKDPYDEDRDFVVSVFRKKIPYLKKIDENLLKQLFYRSNEHHYCIGNQIFNWSDPCNYIYIVTQGVVSIDLTDGVNSRELDLLGRGSVIGYHNILLPFNFWNLNCVA